MRKRLVGTLSGATLFVAAVASPAAAAPNERACAHEPHGTERAHATVPHRNQGTEQAHRSIPHFCQH